MLVLVVAISLVVSVTLVLAVPAQAAYTWTSTGGPGTGNGIGALSAAFDSTNHVIYVGTVDGSVWRLIQSSGSWTSMGNPEGQPAIALLYDGAILYAGTANGGVWRNSSPATGNTWTASRTPDGVGVRCLAFDGTNLFAGVGNGTVERNTNPSTGNTWQNAGSPDGSWVMSLDFFGSHLYAGTWNGNVARNPSPVTGSTWVNTGTPDGSRVFALTHDSTNLYAGTGGGNVRRNPSPATDTTWQDAGHPGGNDIARRGLSYDDRNDILYTFSDQDARVSKNINPSSGNTWLNLGQLPGASSYYYAAPLFYDLDNNLLYAGNAIDPGSGFVGLLYNAKIPAVASVNPVSAPRGSTLDVVIAGENTNFQAPVQAFFSGTGITVNSTTLENATQVTANVTIAPDAALGARDVWVTYGTGTDADKANRKVGAFAVEHPQPTITGITPSSGTQGTRVSVTNLAGTGFYGNPTVKLKKTGKTDITATNVSVVSSKKLTCKLPLPANALPGAWNLYVQNPDGKNATKTGAFTVNSAASTWYLAEGSTNYGFDAYITIQNPNKSKVTAKVTYMTGSGPVTAPSVSLPPKSQATVNPRDKLGNQDFSTKVSCKEGKTIAVDRTMSWTGQGAASPEAHSSIGVTSPSKTWYLPEGSSQWGFECWLLIQNPNASAAKCTITYMIEGQGPKTVSKSVPASSRKTFNMADDIGEKDASIKVVSNIPVIPERAMYRNSRREGHDSIGTTSPAGDFYLAEGTSAYGFTTYVLVQNPNSTPADVTVTYMTPTGPKPQAPFSMAPNSRKTIRVNDVLPNTDFSTKVHGTKPIIAERAMYWDNGTGEACHDSVGMASAHTSFYLPDGQTSEGRETFTLVQNPNSSAVTVEITYMTPTGAGNKTFQDTIPANSRMTYNMADKGIQGRAAIMVTSKTAGKKIMVERAMYWNSRGAGTDTIGGFSD